MAVNYRASRQKPPLNEGNGERKYSTRNSRKDPRKYSEEVARGEHAPPLSLRASTEKFSVDRAEGGCDTPPLSRNHGTKDKHTDERWAMPPSQRSSLDGESMGPSRAARAAQKAACRK